MERATLYRFFAGTASTAEKETIRQWLEEDAARRQELLTARAFYDAVMLADEKRMAAQPHPAYRLRRAALQTLKWAAVLLIGFFSHYLFLHTPAETAETAFNTISVPAGQRVNLFLPDGTKVCLNAGSTFTYPALFAADHRQVELDGEAFFEVSTNKKRPFVVHTPVCDVEVLGTKFNVDAYASTQTFSAALMEGKIKVQNNTCPSEIVHLSPNQQVTLSRGRLAVNPIRDYDIYRWKEGLICFKDLNFVELMKRIEKYYGIALVIENPSLVKHAFSGTFRISDGIENLLRVLQKDVNYRYTRSEDGNTIYIR